MEDNTAAGSSETAGQKAFAAHELKEFAWSVLDNLPTAVVVCETVPEGLRVVYNNPPFSALLQLADDVIPGANLASLLEDGLDEPSLAALVAPSEQIELQLELAPGHRATLQLTPHSTMNQYWIASIEQQPAVLDEPSRGVLESMINASRNLVAAKDLEGRYVSVNSAFAEFFGQPRNAILGLSRQQFEARQLGLPTPDSVGLTPAEAQVVRSGRPTVERGMRIADAAGHERVMDVMRTPVVDEHHNVKFLISVATDSTEIDYWNQRYEVQTELLAQLMDAIPDPIWVCDSEGGFVRTNHAFRSLITETLGTAELGYGFVADPNMARQMRTSDQRVIERNKKELVQDVLVGEGQYRWLDVWKVPMSPPGDDGGCVVSVGHDITDRYLNQVAQREQLRGTRLVAKISSMFVSHPPEQTDRQLVTALGDVAEYAGAFRCIVRELPRTDGIPNRVLEWRADGVIGSLEDTAPWQLSWLMAELDKHGYVLCRSTSELPPAASAEAEICRREGINAFIAAPLKLHGHVRGILFVNCLRSNPDWSDTTAESISVCADILAAAIDRVHTQHRLTQASTQLREIATSIPGAIFQWEMAAKINRLNYVSEGIAALTELDYDEVVAAPSKILDLVDADSRRSAVRRALQASERLETFQMEVPVNLPRSGRRRWVKLSVSARQSDTGSILLDGLINDVTAVKRHEQALLAARNQLDGVTRSIPGMVYQARYNDDLSTDNVPVPAMLFVSQGARDVYGVPAQQILADPSWMSRMILVEDLPALRVSLARAIRQIKPWNHEFRIRDASGKLKWLQARAVPVDPGPDGGVQFNGVIMDATDRERTVRRLRDAEDELRDLTAQMPGFVFRMDVFDHGRTRLSYISEGVSEIYAMTAEEVLAADNQTLAGMVVEADQGLMDQAVSDALRTGTTVTLERRLIDARGDEHWLQTLLRPQPSLDGSVSLVGVTLDISERKQAETALAAAEQRVVEVTQALPGLVFQFFCSPSGELSWRYLQGRTITGRDVEELADDFARLEEHVHLDDQERIRRAVLESARDLTPLEVDFRVLMPDGQQRWARVSADSKRVPGGTIFNGFGLDITDRKKAEEALLASEERYRAVVQDQSEIVCRMDAQGRVMFINEAAARCFGHFKECLGKHWWALLPVKSRDVAQQTLMALDSSRPADGIELRGSTDRGESVWHQWRLRAFVTPEGVLTGYQAVGRDVTELKGLERQVRSIADREQQRIGHDLHDGLGQELTGLSLLLKGLEHGAVSQAPELLADVKNAQQVLNDSIATARALAQGLSPVHLERDGLAGALEQLASNVESLHHVPVVVSHRGSREIGVSIVTEFYRIAQEAVNNAARHANANRIDVGLDFEDGIRLVVSDDGCGIQDDSSHGMGLRIMRYRADLLGAQFSVKQDETSGTMVICELTKQGLEVDE